MSCRSNDGASRADMDHARAQESPQSKGAVLRHREHSDESVDKRPTDSPASTSQDEKRMIRRVRSPSRPRAWLSNSYKPKFAGRFYRPRFPRDDCSFYRPGFSSPKYHHFNARAYFYRKDHFQPKLHHMEPREKERYEQRESADGSPPPKPNSATRPFVSRSSTSRDMDKDMQFTFCQSDRNQSRERDHRGTRSKERERSRDREPPSAASQAAARDRAIQQKRREIDEVYYQECEMFGLVAKMLIAKDQSLERPIQSSLQENLRDIGKRCVEAMEKFIEDYDSRELSY